jgi:hypothetical protein
MPFKSEIMCGGLEGTVLGRGIVNLHSFGNVLTPWVGTMVPLAESAWLKEETS